MLLWHFPDLLQNIIIHISLLNETWSIQQLLTAKLLAVAVSVDVLIAQTLYKQYTTTDNTTSTHRETRPEIQHRSTY